MEKMEKRQHVGKGKHEMGIVSGGFDRRIRNGVSTDINRCVRFEKSGFCNG